MRPMNKSSRHSKITGDFGEHLTLYLLSKFGFECARVDHTGIDIIARNLDTAEVMGITVKARSRNLGRETTSLRIAADHFEKVTKACSAFNCVPYFSIVIDRGDLTSVYLLPETALIELYPNAKRGLNWGMSDNHISRYRKHARLTILEFESKITQRWSKEMPL